MRASYIILAARTDRSGTLPISDSKEVLFIPDVIPLAGKVNSECNIKVPVSYLNFSDELFRDVGLNEDTVIEKGDYIAFYDGPIAETTTVEYVLIENVYRDASYYYIDYTPVTADEVMASMDVFHTRTEVPELSDEKIEEINILNASLLAMKYF